MSAILGLAPITPDPGNPAPISNDDLLCWQVVISAEPTNSGFIYIEDKNNNILAKIAGGQSFVPPGGDQQLNLRYLLLDADTTGQTCYVSYSD